MDKETKKCPFCGEEILVTAKKCKHCKQFLPNDTEKPTESTTKTCPFCGEEIMASAKKCKHCGEWLDYQDKQEQSSIVHCQFCGKAVSSSAEKCPSCGEWLKDENPELSCGLGLKNTVTTWVLYCSIFLAILALLIVALGANGDPADQVVIEIIVWPIVAFICSFISLYVYLFPSIFAMSKNHPQFLAILLVNIFFGESGLGWIACMVWATIHRQGRHTHW